MLKAKDLRDQSVEELIALERDVRSELFDLINNKKTTKKLEKPHLFREKRSDVAKILTVIREKQIANQ